MATLDPRKSRIIELRFFGGLNTDETAEVMELSPTTVQREWRAARAWLRRFIEGETYQNRGSDRVVESALIANRHFHLRVA